MMFFVIILKNIFNMLLLSTDPIEPIDNKIDKTVINYNTLFKFLTFDKYNGKITSISNKFKKPDKENLICKKFIVINTHELLKKYVINYDYIKKKYYLCKKQNKSISNKLDDRLSELEFTYIKTLKKRKEKFDIRFLQFLDNNYLLIQSNNLLVYRFLKNNESNHLIDLFFTNINDRDLLYKKIVVDLNQLVESDLLIDISTVRSFCSPLDIVIYCKKISYDYQTIIIDSYNEIERQQEKSYNIQNVGLIKEHNNNYDLIFNFNKNINVLTAKIGKSFDTIEIVDSYFTFYIMEPNLDFFIEKIKIDVNLLLKNKVYKYKIKNTIDFNKNIILHNYNYLKVQYENSYN